MIRLAEPRDLEAVVAIYNASIPGRASTADTEPVSVESRRRWLRDRDPARRPLWVLERDGDVAGWLGLQDFYGRPAYAATAELGVYVDPRRRRRGAGRALVEHALAAAPTLGIETLLGLVFAHNDASLALLEGVGFERWGRLPAVARLDGVDRDVVIVGRRV